ncbi:MULTISPECIES: hypothetical protein [unclassified Rhizobium]|uniref:hypothetical protein n=1 Tax=unclassified Rhizobium TaxID=2613769 RepID=UPI000BD447D0|nr:MULTISPECIES: hypothetical protein [unclassified Rhizobium]MDH7806076.1 hypothetical protein [Rhizobium sp. AN67]MDQ4407491.1 hypothetical protein [Rhizobium sp. AN63]SOD59016.1 hypothetical protein SAMN05216595_4598 [Rhizobium sp. AN6A]
MKTIAIPMLAVVALLGLSGCQRDEPRDVAKVSGRMFVFNYRVAIATYLVTLQRIAPIRDGSTLEATFENPRGGAELTTREKIFAADEKIAVQSPPVECVKQDRPYKVTIRIKGPEGDVLQTIETTIRSDTDQSLLPAKPLTVGPLYTPNPDVFKADGTTDMRPVEGCPAS